MTANNTTAFTQRVNDEDLNQVTEHFMSKCESAMILRMLSEAPGCIQDIAMSLKFSITTVEREMGILVANGLVMEVKDRDEPWFRIANQKVETAVSAIDLRACHTKILRDKDSRVRNKSFKVRVRRPYPFFAVRPAS